MPITRYCTEAIRTKTSNPVAWEVVGNLGFGHIGHASAIAAGPGIVD